MQALVRFYIYWRRGLFGVEEVESLDFGGARSAEGR